jgi:hypothetical protein
VPIISSTLSTTLKGMILFPADDPGLLMTYLMTIAAFACIFLTRACLMAYRRYFPICLFSSSTLFCCSSSFLNLSCSTFFLMSLCLIFLSWVSLSIAIAFSRLLSSSMNYRMICSFWSAVMCPLISLMRSSKFLLRSPITSSRLLFMRPSTSSFSF